MKKQKPRDYSALIDTLIIVSFAIGVGMLLNWLFFGALFRI